jgi:hypothetical protein
MLFGICSLSHILLRWWRIVNSVLDQSQLKRKEKVNGRLTIPQAKKDERMTR